MQVWGPERFSRCKTPRPTGSAPPNSYVFWFPGQCVAAVRFSCSLRWYCRVPITIVVCTSWFILQPSTSLPCYMYRTRNFVVILEPALDNALAPPNLHLTTLCVRRLNATYPLFLTIWILSRPRILAPPKFIFTFDVAPPDVNQFQQSRV